jgi:hypothetical protein
MNVVKTVIRMAKAASNALSGLVAAQSPEPPPWGAPRHDVTQSGWNDKQIPNASASSEQGNRTISVTPKPLIAGDFSTPARPHRSRRNRPD